MRFGPIGASVRVVGDEERTGEEQNQIFFLKSMAASNLTYIFRIDIATRDCYV